VEIIATKWKSDMSYNYEMLNILMEISTINNWHLQAISTEKNIYNVKLLFKLSDSVAFFQHEVANATINFI
jgi:hypothetical protein